ncbi:apomucin-like [Rhipicephalus sanguineus]|uniref:apomucin-like n=1 Tax=Rhipicephalus sanguineus TaxID=34632 RepID=UPI001893E98C|nr:apomucin-like [Rhipicephalus sanguineus]
MQYIAAVLATIFIVPVNGDGNCSKTGGCKPSACGPLEVAVSGQPRHDNFCRPLFTPPWELRKLRRCVCKRRYLRNSWGECVPRLKCIPCQFRWQKDYRECADGCPATCNLPFSKSCDKPCAPGCACPPGWVVYPGKPWKCIKAYRCLPKCPAHSEFQACVSSCRPKCGRVPPEKCEFNCDRGACVCKKGYIELEQDGKTKCVRKAVCSWIVRKPSFKPSAVLHSGSGGGSPTTTTSPAGTIRQPGNMTVSIATVSSNGTQTHPVGTPSSGVASQPAGIVSAGTQGGGTVSGVSGTSGGNRSGIQDGGTMIGEPGSTGGSIAGTEGVGTVSGVSGTSGGSSARIEGESTVSGISGTTEGSGNMGVSTLTTPPLPNREVSVPTGGTVVTEISAATGTSGIGARNVGAAPTVPTLPTANVTGGGAAAPGAAIMVSSVSPMHAPSVTGTNSAIATADPYRIPDGAVLTNADSGATAVASGNDLGSRTSILGFTGPAWSASISRTPETGATMLVDTGGIERTPVT